MLASAPVFACVPETDLTNIPTGGDGPGGGASAAGATLVDPVAGAIDVPLNLAAVVVKFSASVTWGVEGLRVCDGDGGPIAAMPPAEEPCDSGACYRVALAGRLPPAVPCRIVIGTGTTDAGGAALEGGVVGIFEAAAEADETPPAIADLSIAAAGPCLTVSFSTDEPATATVVLQANGIETTSPAGVGQTRFDVALALTSLPPESAATIAVTATDRAGNVAASSPLAFETPPPVPPIAITEVLANAAGPEPAQEYVELRNLGPDPVSLAGLRLEDSKGGDDLPAETLAPDGYALVVPSGYDAAQGQDPAPRAGTLLVRVDSRIGADGLANGGEIVRLLSGDTVVSSYGGWVSVSASSWSGKGVHRLVQTACDRPDAWNRTPLAATPGAGPP
ncbi:MAG TPA: lamin tail domain-containing protein [Polyangia bacterium]|nr:lamin tail domain-containing protein [Polyangia bacterium]